MNINRLAIFCGSKTGNNSSYMHATEALADALTERSIGAVFGGGRVGLMGILADRVLANGGEVIGVIPKKLKTAEVAHTEVSELHVVDTMHQRKALMAELSDGFIALPGGIGTLEEIVEVFTWHQIGYHQKPCAFLNTDGYYDKLFAFIDQMVTEGFLDQNTRNSLIIENSPESLFKRLSAIIS
ncbi:LOG family protein [Marinoscillum furvescens]|uniref:Cytokinin riboside 5'-monophosphate phosphoribohydrolase n=1 Tax=Marinoscillum furvescens DSM 4134 TaxID=1122208 RepID=A0A3D9LK19_MARFU|nr:TIGR00730 family Rossman fold protein [Marinoscillum furvescens]REE05592.1 hypothetical protein C7460_101109 [Marinoscillum furvescens DSM 4134]